MIYIFFDFFYLRNKNYPCRIEIKLYIVLKKQSKIIASLHIVLFVYHLLVFFYSKKTGKKDASLRKFAFRKIIWRKV